MHTVTVLDDALHAAGRLGFEVRHEWFDGSGGGSCELRGRKLLFIDLAQSADEQLAGVIAVLRQHPGVNQLPLPTILRQMVT